MFPFQFGQFFRTIFLPGAMAEGSARRMVLRVLIGVTFPFHAFTTWLGLLLDYVFFGGFTEHKVDRPVFVIGNPRSGTTFLHRVLARDEINFTTTRMWQLAFPSLTQRAIISFFGKIDAALGGPFAKLLEQAQNRVMKNADKMHKFRFEVPEEDEGYFVHPFASGFLAMIFPRKDWDYYNRMDEMRHEDRHPLMTYYHRCIQRHLYVDPQGRRLLSKNPLFCAKIQSVYDYFPGAKIVYVVRNPAEMLASVQNLLVSLWRAQGIDIPYGQPRPGLVDWTKYCYDHCLEVLDRLPQTSYYIVRYDDLVANPRETVEKLYSALDIPMTPQYQAALAEEEAKARKYKSEHEYSLEKFGLTHKQVEEMVPEVYRRFGFKKYSEEQA